MATLPSLRQEKTAVRAFFKANHYSGGESPLFFMDLKTAQEIPGYLGPLLDDTPSLNQSHVRAFVWPILLFRGAVRPSEIIASLASVCLVDDLKVGFYSDEYDDKTRAEILVDEVLGEMTLEGLLRYNEKEDIWVLALGENKVNLAKLIGVACSLNGSLPNHILLELSQREIFRVSGVTS